MIDNRYISFDLSCYTYWKDAEMSDDTVILGTFVVTASDIGYEDDPTKLPDLVFDYVANNITKFILTDQVKELSVVHNYRKVFRSRIIKFAMNEYSSEHVCVLTPFNIKFLN